MENTISYDQKVNKIVDNIMNEKNDNPRDSAFRFLQLYHSEAQHISLRYPGEFVKTLGTETFTINNRNLRMDGAELVNPDDTLPYQSTINPEQQTKELNQEKIDAMYDYKLQMIFKHKMPCLNLVVKNTGDGDYVEIFESHGDAFKVYFRVFNDSEISKRLNTLTYKIEIKNKLSEIEALDFGYIPLFAQDNKAKEYTEKVAKLFKNANKLDKGMQIDIHYVLKKLIRLHFRDDKIKTRRLLTMITKAVHPDNLDQMTTLEKVIKRTEDQEQEINTMKHDLTQKDEEINQKDNVINQKDNVINQKDEEIRKLKSKLKENNIEY